MFPERLTFSIADWVNAWVDALVTNYGDLFRKISDTLLWAIVNLEGLLRATPWWLLLAIVAAIAWHATRRLLPTLVITGLLFLFEPLAGRVTFLPMADKAVFAVNYGVAGLLAEPMNLAAEEALRDWR